MKEISLQNEEQNLVERLIEAGFWDVKDEGTPLEDEEALAVLLDRVESRLVKPAFFYINGPSYDRAGYEMRLVWPRGKCLLGTGSSLNLVISKAALALASFLRDHPECARREEG